MKWSEGSTRVVKAGTKTWFVTGEVEVAEFAQDTSVVVEGPDDGDWFITIAPIFGFPPDKKVFLKEEHFVN